MYASFFGHFKIAKVLLEHQAFVDVVNKVSLLAIISVHSFNIFMITRAQDGITPLMGASQNGCIEVVKILVVHRANVNARDLVRLYDSRILSLTMH